MRDDATENRRAHHPVRERVTHTQRVGTSPRQRGDREPVDLEGVHDVRHVVADAQHLPVAMVRGVAVAGSLQHDHPRVEIVEGPAQRLRDLMPASRRAVEPQDRPARGRAVLRHSEAPTVRQRDRRFDAGRGEIDRSRLGSTDCLGHGGEVEGSGAHG